MDKFISKLEELLELGGMKRDVVFLILGGLSLIFSLAGLEILPLIRRGLRLFFVVFPLFWKRLWGW